MDAVDTGSHPLRRRQDRRLASAGGGDRFESRVHAEGAKEVADVISDCFRAEVELGGDLFGGASVLEQLEHLGLSRRQMRLGRSGFLVEWCGE
jgi:hypothetical protein